ATPSSGTCTQTGGTVTCPIDTLANGATATVTIVVRVPGGFPGASITDLASASSDTTDTNLQNNTAGATATIRTSADLQITNMANPTTVTPGETVSFAITVSNLGPSDAQSVTLSDAIDTSSLQPRSSDHDDVCQLTAAQLSCQLSSLATDDSFTVHLVV